MQPTYGNGQDESMDDVESGVENGEPPHPMKKSKVLTKECIEKLFEDVDNFRLKKDEKWFIVSLNWWKKLDYAVKQGYIEDIPPIDNDNISMRGSDGKYYLAPTLVEKMDYILIPEHVFKDLRGSMGVANESRDVIERTVVSDEFRKILFVEVYPKIVNVVLASDLSKRAILHVRKDSIGQLRDRALQELGITENLERIRFYNKGPEKYEPLTIDNADELVSTVFSSEVTIVIDVVDQNGVGFIRVKDSSHRNRDRSWSLWGRLLRWAITLLQSQFPASSLLSLLAFLAPFPLTSSHSEEGSPTPSTRFFQRGKCGLQNLGNTCFMASAIQCLSNVPPITEYFLSDLYVKDINEENPLGTQGELARAYGQLLHGMWSGGHPSIVPRNLKNTIGKFAPRFSGFSQQDSQELLAFLLDGLHEDLNRVKKKPYVEEEEAENGEMEARVAEKAWEGYKIRNDSIIVDKVHGQLKSTLVCPNCQKVSIKFDPFCFLSVPVPMREKNPRNLPVVLIRNPPNKRWAKFSVQVARRSTAGEVVAAMKASIEDPSIELVLFTSPEGGAPSILGPDDVVAPDNSFRLPTIYAAALRRSRAESSLVMARAFCGDSPLCLPMVFAIPPSSIPDDANDPTFSALIHAEITKFFLESFAWTENGEAAAAFDDGVVPKLDIDIGDLNVRVKLRFESPSCLPHASYKGDDLVEREISVINDKAVSLLDCVKMFTKEEQLSEQDSWYCPTCKEHVRATKKLDLWKLPEILIIHLKRFQYSRWSREKIDTHINIPISDFHLRDYLANQSHDDAIYDLVAVSHHMGGLGGGHYTATGLNGNEWLNFNDSIVSTTSAPCGKDGVSPYMLFYHRRQPPSPIHSDCHLEMETDE